VIELTEHQEKILYVIIEFLKATKDGLVKPYDATPYIKKLQNMRDRNIEDSLAIDDLIRCCPTNVEIRDAKDFKPYIEASLKLYAEILNLKV